MIKKTLTVLLIEDNPEYAELVQRWLSLREDATFVLSWTDSLMEGMNILRWAAWTSSCSISAFPIATASVRSRQ
jgi:hypothetical protein